MPVILYRSWRDFPVAEWRWPNFSPAELACRGTGQLMIDPASLDKLQALRTLLGVPLVVLSAYRSPEHNRRVGGAEHSQHLLAHAYDISMANLDPAAFEAAARSVGFTGFGYYPHQNFMHIDTGPARQWGTPFPPRPRARRVETEEAAEPGVAADEVTERFAPEARAPTVIEAIAKPEIVAPVATSGLAGVLAAFRDTLATSLPLQIALAVLLVAVPLGLAWWLVTRQRAVRRGD